MPRFARTRQLLGREPFETLAAARVAVFGLGGVGSYAVEALTRAGVGFLRLVDFDVVNVSNTNRQLFALESTVGRPKVEVAAERVRAINPACTVDARQVFIDGESVGELLDGPLDAVVDAIDSVSSKVHLIRESVAHGYFTVSSMGAAGRMDAGAVVVGDITDSYNCPLARIVRKRLRRQGVHGGVRCVYSPEPSRNNLAPLETDIELVPQTRGRARTPLGSISYVPGVFGLHVAGEVIGRIVGNSAG
jgi:tRNA threonylcarbamoyladenosine dehydratase